LPYIFLFFIFIISNSVPKFLAFEIFVKHKHCIDVS
jgi:hypothetical protein